MKKLSVKTKRVIAAVAAAVLLCGTFFLGFKSREWFMNPAAAKLDEILKLIEDNYDGEFDRDKFISSAVSGTLDRYSTYYTESEYKETEDRHQGINKGKLGISFYTGTNRIYSVAGNSPAEKAGITSGEIVGIKAADESEYKVVAKFEDFSENYSAFELDEEFFVKIKNGENIAEYAVKKSDYVESYVWYKDFSGSYGLTLNKGVWQLEKLGYSLPVDVKEGYAYIKFSSFYGEAENQMEKALEKMKENGIKKVVLDLRKNGGGYMNVFCGISRFFCPGKSGQPTSIARYTKSSYTFCAPKSANRYDDFAFESIALLMDSGSASASEALAGAILDYDEKYNKNIVKIVLADSVAVNSAGEEETVFRSYGKGIMQTTFTLSDGSAIKMTTAHILWPVTKKTIHGSGITTATDEKRVFNVKSVEGKDAQAEFAMS